MDFDNALQKLNDLQRSKHLALYLGTACTKADFNLLNALSWKFVVTTSREAELVDYIKQVEDRPLVVVEIYSKDQLYDLQKCIMEKNTLVIIRLNGIEGITLFDSEDPKKEARKQKNLCRTILNYVMRQVTITTTLMFAGYDAMNENEVDPLDLQTLCEEQSNGGQFIFWGCKEDTSEDEYFQELIQDYNHEAISYSLLSLFEAQEENDMDVDDELEVVDTDKDILLFCNSKKVTIPSRRLYNYKEDFQLLSENVVNANIPYGREAQREAFYSYLNHPDTDWPLWYAYSKNTDFYLKRSFSDELYNATKELLENNKDYNNNIILCGESGTGKTVTLQYLAYRIYMERKYPVIYIKNPLILFNMGSQELEALYQLLHIVDNNQTRVLIVWDCARYQDSSLNARFNQLVSILSQKSLRFVLVGTSYVKPKAKSNSQIDKNQYIETKRYVANDVEGKRVVFDLFKKIRSKAQLNSAELDDCYVMLGLKDKNKNSTVLEASYQHDICKYFYYLVALIQPKIETGFSLMQKSISQYVYDDLNKKLSAIKKEEEYVLSDIDIQLRKAGFILDDPKEDEEENIKIQIENLERFNLTIALFSMFKLQVPYSFARNMFFGTAEHDWNKDRVVMEYIDTAFPWIHCVDQAYFEYNNSFDAQLKIAEQKPEILVDLVCDVLEIYKQDNLHYQSPDLSMETILQHLLRLIGPNSVFYNNEGASFQNPFIDKLDCVIDKLKDLRESSVSDPHCAFRLIEATFIREYYQNHQVSLKDSDGTLEKAFKDGDVDVLKSFDDQLLRDYLEMEKKVVCKLIEAHGLTQETTEKLEQLKIEIQNTSARGDIKFIDEQYQTAVVEAALLVGTIRQRHGHFCQYVESSGIEMEDIEEIRDVLAWDENSNKENIKNTYRNQFKILSKQIHYDSNNGYLYNALFQSFIDMKDIIGVKDPDMFSFVASLQSYVEDASFLDSENRGSNGNDEIYKKIIAFFDAVNEMNGNVPVSIASLDQNVEFKNQLNHMVEQESPAGVIFVCQQELHQHRLDRMSIREDYKDDLSKYEQELSLKQLQKLQEILDFLDRPEYECCIKKYHYSTFFRLEILWMLKNKRILFEQLQCQKTYITKDDWGLIQSACKDYIAVSKDNPRPIAYMLLALSHIHYGNSYSKAYDELRKLTNRRVISGIYSTPFIVCDETGKPVIFTGRIQSIEPSGVTGFMTLTTVNLTTDNGKGSPFHFHKMNIPSLKLLRKGDVVHGLQMALNYKGFTMMTEEGRIDKIKR